jgi:hypothetical protein
MIEQIEKMKIPILKYDSIPDVEIRHFHNISFLILDWRLVKKEISTEDLIDGVRLPQTLQKNSYKENIQFLKTLNKTCFSPILIFTNEVTEEIEDLLISEKLLVKDCQSNILIKSKSDLIDDGSVFHSIISWVYENPAIYVLKRWDVEYQKSKNLLFSTFFGLSSVWPKILWDNFNSDGVNPSIKMGDLISKNLQTRMSPFNFEDEVLNRDYPNIKENEIKLVLEGERFLTSLDPKSISTGDIFKMKGKYYINIRPTCDLIPRNECGSNAIDNIDLYLLMGNKLSEEAIEESFEKAYGLFRDKEGQFIIFPIDQGKAIDFRFNKLVIKKWQEVKDKRIGRLIPPFITKLQQRYSNYLHREGLPKIPIQAINHNTDTE